MTEEAFYGRTGILSSRFEGLPVRSLPSNREIKWRPTLLVLPQILVNRMIKGKSAVDKSILLLLWTGVIIEVLEQLNLVEQKTAVVQSVLNWCFGKENTTSLVEHPKAFSGPVVDFSVPELNLLIMKEGAVVQKLSDMRYRAAVFVGKDKDNDVVTEHPSCSSQHAVLFLKFCFNDFDLLLNKAKEWRSMATTAPTTTEVVCYVWKELLQLLEEEVGMGGDAATMWEVKLCVTDLNSTNGTFLNKERLRPGVVTPLADGDVLQFGVSSRRYVLIRV